MTNGTFSKNFENYPRFDTQRNLSGPPLPLPEFRWMYPDWTRWGWESLPIIRPRSIEHPAQAFLEPPACQPNTSARWNPWLSKTKALEEDPALQGPHSFQLANGKWLLFGAVQFAGYGMYRLVLDPGKTQTDRWTERQGGVELADRFAALSDAIDLDDPREAVTLLVKRVADFAKIYGPLGYGAYITLRSDCGPDSVRENFPYFYAEPIAYWIHESMTLRAAMRLRHALKVGRNQASLQRAMLSTPHEARFDPRAETMWPRAAVQTIQLARKYGSDPLKNYSMTDFQLMKAINTQRQIFSAELGVPLIGADHSPLFDAHTRFQQQSFARAAHGLTPVLSDEQLRIQKLVEDARKQATAELVSVLDVKLTENVAVHSFNVEGQAVAMFPRNLLGALYLYLAEEMAGQKPRVPCCDNLDCGRPILGRKRVRKENYCDDACRQEARRARLRRESSRS